MNKDIERVRELDNERHNIKGSMAYHYAIVDLMADLCPKLADQLEAKERECERYKIALKRIACHVDTQYQTPWDTNDYIKIAEQALKEKTNA
jgi:hypothetical protein